MCRRNLIKERHEALEEVYEIEAEKIYGEHEPEDPDAPIAAEYTRSKLDAVISGPLGLGNENRPGRWFGTTIEALHWAKDKYGEQNVSIVEAPEGAVRWAVLVKNLRA